MAELMTLELHYPTNWAYEGEVDVLYSDGSGELSLAPSHLGLG